MSIGGFLQEGKKSQHPNPDGWDDDSCQPLDLSDDGNLPIEGQELEEKEKIPFRTRQVGAIGRVSLGLVGHTDKGCQNDQEDKNTQRDDYVLEDAVWPEALAAIELTLVPFVDFLFGFVVHVSLVFFVGEVRLAVLDDQEKMHANQACQRRGQHPDMGSEKALQGQRAQVRAAAQGF